MGTRWNGASATDRSMEDIGIQTNHGFRLLIIMTVFPKRMLISRRIPFFNRKFFFSLILLLFTKRNQPLPPLPTCSDAPLRYFFPAIGGSNCSFTSHIETTGSVLAKSRNKKKNQQKLPTTIPISDQVSVGNPQAKGMYS